MKGATTTYAWDWGQVLPFLPVASKTTGNPKESGDVREAVRWSGDKIKKVGSPPESSWTRRYHRHKETQIQGSSRNSLQSGANRRKTC